MAVARTIARSRARAVELEPPTGTSLAVVG
jgi:hypothetical protein